MKEGWICPRCGKVNAPFVEQCTCNSSTCDNNYYYYPNGFCDHVWGLTSFMRDTAGRFRYQCCKCGKTIYSVSDPNFNENF